LTDVSVSPVCVLYVRQCSNAGKALNAKAIGFMARVCEWVRLVESGKRWPKGNKNHNYNINDRCYTVAGIGTPEYMARATDSRPNKRGAHILTAINKL